MYSDPPTAGGQKVCILPVCVLEGQPTHLDQAVVHAIEHGLVFQELEHKHASKAKHGEATVNHLSLGCDVEPWRNNGLCVLVTPEEWDQGASNDEQEHGGDAGGCLRPLAQNRLARRTLSSNGRHKANHGEAAIDCLGTDARKGHDIGQVDGRAEGAGGDSLHVTYRTPTMLASDRAAGGLLTDGVGMLLEHNMVPTGFKMHTHVPYICVCCVVFCLIALYCVHVDWRLGESRENKHCTQLAGLMGCSISTTLKSAEFHGGSAGRARKCVVGCVWLALPPTGVSRRCSLRNSSFLLTVHGISQHINLLLLSNSASQHQGA